MKKEFKCPHCGIRLYVDSEPEIDYDYPEFQPVKYPVDTVFVCACCKIIFNEGYLRWESPSPITGLHVPPWRRPIFLCGNCARKYGIDVRL